MLVLWFYVIIKGNGLFGNWKNYLIFIFRLNYDYYKIIDND